MLGQQSIDTDKFRLNTQSQYQCLGAEWTKLDDLVFCYSCESGAGGVARVGGVASDVHFCLPDDWLGSLYFTHRAEAEDTVLDNNVSSGQCSHVLDAGVKPPHSICSLLTRSEFLRI